MSVASKTLSEAISTSATMSTSASLLCRFSAKCSAPVFFNCHFSQGVDHLIVM